MKYLLSKVSYARSFRTKETDLVGGFLSTMLSNVILTQLKIIEIDTSFTAYNILLSSSKPM